MGETARFFGITRERVRQIEVVAIRKLRAFMVTSESEESDTFPLSQADIHKKLAGRKP